jgi:hypothetical protein
MTDLPGPCFDVYPELFHACAAVGPLMRSAAWTASA